jgi:VCBS repeat protein/fibronectin type III domain protein
MTERMRTILRVAWMAAAVFIGTMFAVDSAFSQFTQVPELGLPGVFSGSVAWGDYDNDGRLDFLLSGSDGATGQPRLSLWRNTGSGFTDVTASVAPGLPGILDCAVAWGDFDNDGHLDFLITGLTNVTSHFAISQIWRNTGTGFTNVPVPDLPGVSESSVAWSDFDSDGRLDFLLCGTTNGNLSGAISQLWRNTGNGFTNVPIPGILGTSFGSAAWGDFDNDGRPDFLIIGNNLASQLWRNTGSGFTNVPIAGLPAMFVSSVAWGDYDNDGWLDFLVEGFTTNRFIAQLWRNTGNGFTNVPVAGLPGVADGSLAWADFDNDGRLDFLITGLTNDASRISQLWRSTGNGFTNVPVPGLSGNFDNSIAWGDYDNDSRLDFLIAGMTEGGNVSQLWRNNLLASNSPPAVPTGLSATVSGTTVVLNWNPPADDHTPAAGLSYNVRIGTVSGGSDIVSAPALPNGMLITPRMGTARAGSATFHQLTPGRTYYWSVQAVDSAFAGSPFAAEQQFNIGTNAPRITSFRHVNGAFEFGFIGTPGTSFIVLATTNLSSGLSNWTSLGTPIEISPGQFQFTDLQAPDSPQRFYRVRSP